MTSCLSLLWRWRDRPLNSQNDSTLVEKPKLCNFRNTKRQRQHYLSRYWLQSPLSGVSSYIFGSSSCPGILSEGSLNSSEGLSILSSLISSSSAAAAAPFSLIPSSDTEWSLDWSPHAVISEHTHSLYIRGHFMSVCVFFLIKPRLSCLFGYF